MMIFLFEYWKRKLKIIDDLKIYILLHITLSLLAIIILTFCNMTFLKKEDYILVLIINLFMVVYNKPTIIANLQRKKNAFLMIDRGTLVRYVILEIIKENPLSIVAFSSLILTIIFSLFSGKIVFVLLLLTLLMDCYFMDIYKNIYKIILCAMTIICFYFFIVDAKWLVIPFLIFNLLYVLTTLYRELLRNFFESKYSNHFVKNRKINVFKVDLLYFLRMPLDKMIEIVYEILLFGAVLYYTDFKMAFYLIIVIFFVEEELLQEEKMKEFDFFYGRNNFIAFSQISNIKEFFLSHEFNEMIKSIIVCLWIGIVQWVLHDWNINLIINLVNVGLLLAGISYRYYSATKLVIKNRTDIRETWFRLVMLYLVLFSCAPYLFEDTLNSIDGYNNFYGYVFSIIINIIICVSKIEIITNVLGKDRDGEK